MVVVAEVAKLINHKKTRCHVALESGTQCRAVEASDHSVSLLPVTQATGFWLFPRWDSFPLNTPAFAGRTAALLFAWPGSVEVWTAKYLSVGGEKGFHTTCCPSALSRKRRSWAPPRPLDRVSSRFLDDGCNRDSVSCSLRRLRARWPPTPGPCVRRSGSKARY